MTIAPVRLRERRWLETRRRIAEAACELAQELGIENLKAEAIAERAGVSRRTFFNYVSTTDAALAIPFEDYLDRARENFSASPRGENLLDSISAALISAIEPEFVGQMARLSRIASGSDVFARHQVAAWERGERGIKEILATRMEPGTDALFIATMASSVAGAGRAAVACWISAQLARRRKPASKRQTEELVGHLRRALGYLGATLASPASGKQLRPEPPAQRRIGRSV